MICRLWRGWATNQNADAYERIVREQVIPGIEARRIPGFRSIDLVRRERERDVEFMTLMWFEAGRGQGLHRRRLRGGARTCRGPGGARGLRQTLSALPGPRPPRPAPVTSADI